MNSGVLLARVSLQDKVLCVCDVRGTIVFSTSDSYLLGVNAPASSLVGRSLMDHLSEDDKHEYKNAMRRRSGSLLRTLQGAFVWLDIQHCTTVSPRLRKALHRVERVRTAALSSADGGSSSGSKNNAVDITISSNNNSVDNEARKAKAGGGKWRGLTAAVAHDALAREHVLSKERPLEWYTDPAAADDADDSSSLDGDVMMDAPAAADSCLPSIDSLSLHASDSCTSSSSRSSEDELLGWGLHDDDLLLDEQQDDEEQQQQHKRRREALMTNLGSTTANEPVADKASPQPMSREYSFREIFEYIGRTSGATTTTTTGHANGGNSSSSFRRSRQGSRQSGLSMHAMDAGTPYKAHSTNSSRSSTAAAARAVAAVALKASQRPHHYKAPHPQHQQHPQAHIPFRERVAAKCRGAPEGGVGCGGGGSSLGCAPSSWLGGMGGYVAAKAAAVAEETGWDWFVELDLVG